jgi:hypothetical protein
MAESELRGTKYYNWLANYVGGKFIRERMASHSRRVELHCIFLPWCECDIKVDYPNFCSGCYVKFLRGIRKEYIQEYRRFQPYFNTNLLEIAKQIDNFTF